MSEVNIRNQFLVGLVIFVVKRTALKLNDTCESVHIVDCSSCRNLGTETMSSDRSIGNLLSVHKSDNVL